MHLVSTADLIRKIRRLEIRTKNIVNEIFSGEYHSVSGGKAGVQRGAEYKPGDNFGISIGTFPQGWVCPW